MRESMLFFLENVIFTSCVDCHLTGGAELWHHVAYVSSISSYLRQQFDLTLLGYSYHTSSRQGCQHITHQFCDERELIYFSPMLEQINFHYVKELCIKYKIHTLQS